MENVAYRAIIFDVIGTLMDYDSSLRTPTVAHALQSLIENGVSIFLVSSCANVLTSRLAHFGVISKGLIVPFNTGDKLRVFKEILQSRGFKPEEVACIGDNEDLEGYDAQNCGIRFILVPTYRNEKPPSTPEENAQLEKELAAIFGEEIITGKRAEEKPVHAPVQTQTPQPTPAPFSDLPLPKPPERAGACSAQPSPKPTKGFTR